MPARHLTDIICNQRKIGSIICNQRRVVRAYYNGQIIWEKDTSVRLELEKENVYLADYNYWKDTNDVYTNRDFKVG